MNTTKLNELKERKVNLCDCFLKSELSDMSQSELKQFKTEVLHEIFIVELLYTKYFNIN